MTREKNASDSTNRLFMSVLSMISADIAWIVAHVVRGLLMDDAGPDAPDWRLLTPAAERPGRGASLTPRAFPELRTGGNVLAEATRCSPQGSGCDDRQAESDRPA
jgi:hypothetical protein